jgi:hypothetical protein
MIFLLAREGYGAAQISRYLDSEGLADPDKVSLRTIERLVQKARQQDTSGTWNLEEADPSTASLVLDHIARLVGDQRASRWPSRDLAAWVVRVRTICPTMKVHDTHWIANEYLRLTYAKEDTRHLDLFLATRPWEGQKQVSLWFACIGALIAEYESEDVDDAEELYFGMGFSAYSGLDMTVFDSAWQAAKERQNTVPRPAAPSPRSFDDELA